MTPKLVDIKQIEQLAANKAPSKEGAWWIMLQTAESICNSASLREPVNNAYLSEFWTDAVDGVESVLNSESTIPLPYDDLMQMVTFCGDQLQRVVQEPRHNIVKVDTRLMPYRVKNTGSKTMSWLGRQPGKTIKEKLAGKNKMLTQVNEYSYDIRENQVAMMLFRQMMRRVSDRINYGIKSEQIDQLQRIKKLLRNSPLSDVKPRKHSQANNALLSDKNYSIIWRAYLNMTKYDSHLKKNWRSALELYVKAVFLSINAELLSYKDVCVVESRNNLGGLNDLYTSYVVGYQWYLPYIVNVSYHGKSISLDMYDVPLNGTTNYAFKRHIKLTAEEIVKAENYAGRHGTPINWTIVDEEIVKAESYTRRHGTPINWSIIVDDRSKALYADLSGIREINSFLTNKIFSFAWVETEKRDASIEHINGSVAYDIIAGGDQLGIEDNENPTIPVWGSKYAVAYMNEQGIKTFYPGGNRAIHYRAEDFIIVSDAVNKQNNEGLKVVLNEIHNRIILDQDDYFFYLVPDSLEEILQKNLKQCIRPWFSRTFPVWRSVAALTYWLENPDYKFEDDSVFAYIDLVGDTATAGMLTIHPEKELKTQVCNHFPPFPQVEKGDDITEDAFCRQYVISYADKYNFNMPDDVKDNLVRSGSIKALMLKGCYANQFVEISGSTSVYLITFDKDLISKCMKTWLDGIQKFWKIMHQKFERKPNHVLFLSDILINLLDQLEIENDLYSVFNEDEQDNLYLYYSSSDLVLKGALSYKERLNRHLPTWTEYLPHLSLEVIKDGHYAELELIGNDVSFDVMGDDNEHVVEEKLVLRANKKEFYFPLVKQDISRRSTMIDAYIYNKSFPLDHDVVVRLFVKYRYGFDNSYELVLKPDNIKETAFKEIIVEWTNTDRKVDVSNIWPPKTNRLEDSIVLMAIDEARNSFSKIQSIIEKHIVHYYGHNDKLYQIKQISKFLSGNIFKLRNIVLSNLPEVREFMKWFVETPLYKYLGQISNFFKRQDIPDSFFEDNAGKDMNILIGDCLQVMFSIGSYTPKEIQDSFVKRYFTFGEKFRMKAMIDMLLRNGSNHAAIRMIIKEIRKLGKSKDQKTYSVSMYSLVRELGRMCCFDSELIYDFYDVDRSFMYDMTNYIINSISYMLRSIRDMLRKCEKNGDAYKPNEKNVKDYVLYMVALLSFLRLRDPSRTDGFTLLSVGSDDSKKLAREIRKLDDYMMSGEYPINKTIKFKLNKPEALYKMSDLSYALDLYLNGGKEATSIEVVGLEEGLLK